MRIFHEPEDNASRVYLIACPGAIIKSRSYLISSFCVRKVELSELKVEYVLGDYHCQLS